MKEHVTLDVKLRIIAMKSHHLNNFSKIKKMEKNFIFSKCSKFYKILFQLISSIICYKEETLIYMCGVRPSAYKNGLRKEKCNLSFQALLDTYFDVDM